MFCRSNSLWFMIPVLFLLTNGTMAAAQRAELRPATPILLPGTSDSNSPVHWRDGTFMIYQSLGLPLVATGTRQ